MQKSISIDDIAFVRYHTHHMRLNNIYFSILAQRTYLEKRDFECDWDFGKRGVILPNEVNVDQSIPYSIPLASFRRDDTEFYIMFNARKNAFLVTGLTAIVGQKKVYQRFIETLSDVNDISGIELYLQFIFRR